MRATLNPFVEELKTYSASTTLVGTDDDTGGGAITPRSVDDELSDYEQQVASDGDVQYIERIRSSSSRSRRKKKKSSGAGDKSRAQTLARGKDTAHSDSAKRSSLDDSRPGYGGVDGMY
jgi:hypothetical protein